MKPGQKKFITAAEVHFMPNAYIYGDGVKSSYGLKRMEQVNDDRLEWIHKELIDAYIKACSINEKQFKARKKVDLALLKRHMCKLIDDVGEIKRRRGIV